MIYGSIFVGLLFALCCAPAASTPLSTPAMTFHPTDAGYTSPVIHVPNEDTIDGDAMEIDVEDGSDLEVEGVGP